jgi:hypothetical protein
MSVPAGASEVVGTEANSSAPGFTCEAERVTVSLLSGGKTQLGLPKYGAELAGPGLAATVTSLVVMLPSGSVQT